MAAVTHSDDPSEYFRVNAELTKQLVSVCSPPQHFVYVSTVCAHPDGGAYGRSKWLAEETVRSSGRDYTIIRPAEIYGSKGDEGIDALFALARKVHILPDFRQGGSIEYAPISAQAAACFIAEATVYRRYAGQTYTLCADHSCVAPEMARALRNSVRPLFVVPVPIMMLRLAKAVGLPLPFKRDKSIASFWQKPMTTPWRAAIIASSRVPSSIISLKSKKSRATGFQTIVFRLRNDAKLRRYCSRPVFVKHLRVGGVRRLMKLFLQFYLNGRE